MLTVMACTFYHL